MASRHRRAWFVGCALVAFGWLLAAPAGAHLDVLDPPSRHGRAALKEPPCGMLDGSRSATPLVLAPGARLRLRWEEFVDHPSHYRVAFDDDGDDDFVDPATIDERFSNDTVLLDGIEDRAGGGFYEVDVTLPDIECTLCTLQVVQVMYDKPPYGDGNDLYYQCVDLVLERGGVDAGAVDASATDAMPDAGSPSSGSGCALSWARSSAPASPFGVVACLLGLRRRRGQY